MDLIGWFRRLRRDRRRMLFIGQTLGEPSETAALTWMNRHALFGYVSTLLQLTGMLMVLLTLLELCLEFPALSYWPTMAAGMGTFILCVYLLGRWREVWVLAMTCCYATFAVVLLDFAVANLRTPQPLYARVVDSTCYTPPRGRNLETPKQRCELKIQVGRHSHWIDVTGTGQWMSSQLKVNLRRGFLGLTYPERATSP